MPFEPDHAGDGGIGFREEMEGGLTVLDPVAEFGESAGDRGCREGHVGREVKVDFTECILF